jgi:hypothetical protein
LFALQQANWTRLKPACDVAEVRREKDGSVRACIGLAALVSQRWQTSAAARQQSCRAKHQLRACSTAQLEAVITEQALSQSVRKRLCHAAGLP